MKKPDFQTRASKKQFCNFTGWIYFNCLSLPIFLDSSLNNRFWILCSSLRLPLSIRLLETLPGVGRKTANVIASVIYDKPVIAVDTHVFRVSRRIGLSEGTTVEAVEKDLTAGFAEELRGKAHHWLILHGRYTCTARKPKCEKCGIQDYCLKYISDNVIL